MENTTNNMIIASIHPANILGLAQINMNNNGNNQHGGILNYNDTIANNYQHHLTRPASNNTTSGYGTNSPFQSPSPAGNRSFAYERSLDSLEEHISYAQTNQKPSIEPRGNISVPGCNFHDIENELIQALNHSVPRRIPGRSYCCHRCNIPGHFIDDCPYRFMLANNATPYQGKLRSVGEFICHKCKRPWTSNVCFAGETQTCKKCRIEVKPKKMFSVAMAQDLGKIHQMMWT